MTDKDKRDDLIKDDSSLHNENTKEVVENDVDHSNMSVDDLLATYDKESSRLRNLSGFAGKLVLFLAVAMSIFHLYTAAHGTLLAMKQRSLHMIFAFALGFLLYPGSEKSKKDKVSILDWIFVVVSIVVWGYIFLNVEAIALKGGKLSQMDMILGSIAILITLEVTRRVVGPELPIVTIVFLLYAYFGRSMPGMLAHRGFNVQRIVGHMYMTTEGIMGTPLGVSATFVFMFILFGSVLDKTGVGQFFIDFAYALTGSTRSGPAMTSVLSSGLMGSISGSSVANTVTTGAFTIPLMKKVGYKPYYAGAVEATSSTGGQIMPPVMGAAAFIMADFTGFKYVDIIRAAVIPAVLYYIAVGTMVHLEACKLGLKGMPRDQLPKLGKIFREKGYLVIPLIVIITMLIMQKTPMYSALGGIVTAVVVAGAMSLIKKDKSFTLKDIVLALESGAKSSLGVACACACAGMIVGVVTLTGFGLRIAELIVKIAQGQLLPTLMLTMVASLILGMGLPTTAKYIVLATMAVPAITKLNVNLMAAHLFILYFGVVADVTPPVALAAYAGAGIAGANSMKTGVQAFKLSIGAFIIPYVFAMDSHLIMVESVTGTTVNWLPLFTALPTIASALIGTMCLAGFIEGYLFAKCKVWERGLLLVAALSLLVPGLVSDLIGLAVLAFVFVCQKVLRKKRLA
ncbi:TRAP transporter permease [Peptoniphilus catoniae]|uniref:TRAP transporter permease n=1 Tax=Peptoniphilus catoniae TaxID=1660341 RepID=UPI0010FCF343|nr:TRAP transporter permease [Peptoniphilus catoniae]